MSSDSFLVNHLTHMNFIKKYYAKQFRNIIDPRRFVIHKSLEKILISAKFIWKWNDPEICCINRNSGIIPVSIP